MSKDSSPPAHSSALKFNYLLRPRKGVERKMLCESLQRLAHLQPLNQYEYIGFGAFYFADFKLFHRQLGIDKMISIEGDPDIRKRVNFNRPFSCVKILRGKSTKILQNRKWKQPAILWLDYDCVLQSGHLQDIETFVQNCLPNSVLIITTDTDPKALDHAIPDVAKAKLNEVLDSVSHVYKKHEEDTTDILKLLRECGAGDVRLAAFEKRLDGRIPLGITENDITLDRMPDVVTNLIKDEIKRRLRDKNRGVPEEKQLEFVQLYNFRYADGRQMHTYGGIFIRPGQKTLLENSGIFDLDFVCTADDFYEIKIPSLTVKELKYLESYVPTDRAKRKPRRFEIRQDEFKQYCEAYRYYPTYAEFEF